MIDDYYEQNYPPTNDPDPALCKHRYVDVLQSERLAYNAKYYPGDKTIVVDWDTSKFIEGTHMVVHCMECSAEIDIEEVLIQ